MNQKKIPRFIPDLLHRPVNFFYFSVDIDIPDDDEDDDEEALIERRRKERERLMQVSSQHVFVFRGCGFILSYEL